MAKASLDDDMVSLGRKAAGQPRRRHGVPGQLFKPKRPEDEEKLWVIADSVAAVVLNTEATLMEVDSPVAAVLA